MSKFNIINEVSLFFPKFNSWINKIPGKPVKSIESKKEVGKYFLDFLKNEGSWSKSGNRTSFNQIQKMMDLGVVKNICRSHNGYSYLELSDNSQFNIRRQDDFHFKLVAAIYKKLNKLKHNDIINQLFIESHEELYVNPDLIQIEKTELTNDSNHYRTDMSINIQSNIIVIEYLEKQHEKEKNLDYPYEKHRAFNMMFDNKNTDNKIVHIAYYWDHQYHDINYFNQFVNNICDKIIDYADISNEQIYCVRKLSEIIGNKTLAKQIYKAHTNRNEPVVLLEIVESIIKWNKNAINEVPVSKLWYTSFIERVKSYVSLVNSTSINKDAFDDFDGDSESDSDNVNNQQKVTHELYYKIINGDVYLTQAGLHLYLRVEFNFLLGIDEYVKISKFYENITQGLVDILREFRNKEMNLTKHYFTGL
jgi:hypothetical protein